MRSSCLAPTSGRRGSVGKSVLVRVGPVVARGGSFFQSPWRQYFFRLRDDPQIIVSFVKSVVKRPEHFTSSARIHVRGLTRARPGV